MFVACQFIATVHNAAPSVRENNAANNRFPLYRSCITQRATKSNGIKVKELIHNPYAPKCFTIKLAAVNAIKNAINISFIFLIYLVDMVIKKGRHAAQITCRP